MKDLPELLKIITKTTDEKSARHFLFTEGYFGDDFSLPQYYQVSGLENIELEEIDWKNNKPSKVTYPISLTRPKGNYGILQFDIVNPCAYIHLVNLITEKNTWKRLLDSLTADTAVDCYSLPYLGSIATKEFYSIAFKQFNETDVISNSLEYEILAKSDISNFYKNVYTHTLSWVIHGKALAKRNRNNFSLLGNRLDKLIQNSMSGQTNGLPIGTTVSDIIAELLLKEVDKKISPLLRKLKIKALRYRDDYRFLCKTEVDARNILTELGSILNNEFNLIIHDQKSIILRDLITYSIKLNHSNNPVIYELLKIIEETKRIESSQLTNLLLNIHANKTIDKSMLKIIFQKLLTNNIKYEVNTTSENDDLFVQIAILKSFADSFGEISPKIYALVDKMLTSVNDKTLGAEIVHKLFLCTEFASNSVGEIWLHRLANRWSPDIKNEIEANSRNALINVVSNNDVPHYTFFEDAGYSIIDKNELEKFKMFDDSQFTASEKIELEKEPFLWDDYE